MHELTRRLYLDAMGIASYVSRRQLPGAAPTQRLALLRPELSATAEPAVDDNDGPASNVAPTPRRPLVLDDLEPAKARQPSAREAKAAAVVNPPRQQAATPFTIAAATCGDWLWLELLGEDGISPEQLQLIQNMSFALSGRQSRAKMQQFKWPLHQNQQLDLGEEAARAAVTGFIGRKLSDAQCAAVICLGENCRQWVTPQAVGQTPLLCVQSTAAMLQQPLLKAQVWSDLSSLRKR